MPISTAARTHLTVGKILGASREFSAKTVFVPTEVPIPLAGPADPSTRTLRFPETLPPRPKFTAPLSIRLPSLFGWSASVRIRDREELGTRIYAPMPTLRAKAVVRTTASLCVEVEDTVKWRAVADKHIDTASTLYTPESLRSALQIESLFKQMERERRADSDKQRKIKEALDLLGFGGDID